MMIDAHAHLEDRQFNKDRDQLITSLNDNGIELVVNTGSSIETSRQSIDLAHKYKEIYATVGIHPGESQEYKGPETIDILREMAKEDKVVAIGEIGLDYHYDNNPSEDHQVKVFMAQLELAKELDMPVVIHTRDAHQQTLDILKAWKDENPDFHCLVHCFSSSVEIMREYMKLDDFYISLGGATTFKNAKTPKEVAKEIPLDRLLIETDSPYMAPVPYRGKRNEPKYVIEIGENIAKLRNISFDQVREQTTKNAKKFYRIEN